jgi:hypothetical protein
VIGLVGHEDHDYAIALVGRHDITAAYPWLDYTLPRTGVTVRVGSHIGPAVHDGLAKSEENLIPLTLPTKSTADRDCRLIPSLKLLILAAGAVATGGFSVRVAFRWGGAGHRIFHASAVGTSRLNSRSNSRFHSQFCQAVAKFWLLNAFAFLIARLALRYLAGRKSSLEVGISGQETHPTCKTVTERLIG